MNKLFKIISTRPALYEQSPDNIWTDAYISQNMLKAHLNENLDSATRNIRFVKNSVDWIAAYLPPADYPHLLDLGCGPGIYTEQFYKKGYEVAGMDFSERSLCYARSSAQKNKYKINYIQGDYTEVDFCACYELITLIYCDFGVLSKTTRQKLLKKIFNALRPNGVFLFDVFTPLRYADVKESKQWSIEEKGFWREERCLTLQSFYRYEEDHTFLNQYVTVTDKDVSYYNVWEHTFTLEELSRDLTDAGFKEIKAFGDVNGKKYEITGDTICIVAKK